MTDATTFEPQWLSPPGDSILDVLEAHGWTQRELAKRTQFSEKHISQLISGEATLSETTALRLELVLGGTARFWLAREAGYREALARQVQLEAMRADTAWLDELPLTDMRRWGWISKTRDPVHQLAECLEFFRVANVQAWRDQYDAPLTAFRRTDKFELKRGPLSVWIRACEIEATRIDCAPFDLAGVRNLVSELRAVALETDLPAIERFLRDTCAKVGIAVVIVPAPKGCPASGMTKMMSKDRTLLALSLRYKTHDQLIFSVFHELAHIILHKRQLLMIEGVVGLNDEEEAAANQFAADVLIPPERATELHRLRTKGEIVAFSKSIGVHPGIVVGRMEHDGLVHFKTHSNLKLRFE